VDLRGKTALVTGASRGIGRGIARMLAAKGAHIAVNFANSSAEAERLLQEISGIGGKAFAVKADVSDLTAVDAMFEDIKKNFEKLDILVNNAGIGHGGGRLGTVSPDQFDTAFSLNTRGLFFVTQRALSMMAEGGRIINLSSIASGLRDGGGSVYSATKAAVDAFTRVWATELAPRRIAVNSVNPGVVRTDAISTLDEVRVRFSLAKVPMGARMAEIEEIASLVAFLASEEAEYITGACIPISGGRF